MRLIVRSACLALVATVAIAAAPAQTRLADTPQAFSPPDRRNYTQTIVDIPMRDGVKLHTVIVRPKATLGKAPIILNRTPYNAEARFESNPSTNLLQALDGRYDTIIEGGYILVLQDVRGKYGSEGDYVVNRPLVGPLNPTKVDHATDTWDTIDWLIKNVPDNNGRVGTIGVSYDGFLTLMSMVDPHPALKAAVPINPMVDGWIGDDWFHNGAFRAWGVDWLFEQVGTRKNTEKFLFEGQDEYDFYLKQGSAGALGRYLGMDQLGFWNTLATRPNYDGWWQAQAMDKVLGARPLKVPVLIVHSWWDQEDIYGAPAVFAALEPKDTDGSKVFMAAGPWSHGQGTRNGTAIGKMNFGSDTALTFRREVMQPFLDAHLKDGAPKAMTPNMYAFETGTNVWRRYDRWPLSCASGCPAKSRPIYLKPGGALGFEAAGSGGPATYVSDPAKPVPYIPRPVRAAQNGESWRSWLLTDQRNIATRPDVLVFETAPLTAAVKIAGQPVAHLNLTTTGEDGDFVVKLIDVGPNEVPGQAPEMAGYQLMVSADIMRARFRNDPAKPERITPGQPTTVRLKLPHANHVFQPGHRIMVQVQSSWFPLYDRNPQTWVENIFEAPPEAYRAATIKLDVDGADASFVELPIVPAS